MHPVEAHYRRHMEEAAAQGGDALDFHGLDQGKESSLRRYREIADALKPGGKRVLDVACGTAAMLDTFAEMGQLPSHYVGLDGMIENMPRAQERFDRHNLIGQFTFKPMDVRFEELDMPPLTFDVAICTGLAGFWGHHTNRQLKSLVRWMHDLAPHGCLMVPMIYAPDQMGDAHVRRWPADELVDLMGDLLTGTRVFAKEVMLLW